MFEAWLLRSYLQNIASQIFLFSNAQSKTSSFRGNGTTRLDLAILESALVADKCHDDSFLKERNLHVKHLL
jgi:hypothetical protein